MIRLILLIFWCGLLSSPAGEKRALVLGETDQEARRAKAILLGYGFAEKEIKVLSGAALTKDNIVATFTKHLAQGSTPDSDIVLYYHGNGSKVPDLQGDESDGSDEIILSNSTSLTDRTSWITDDIIASLFRRFPKSNRRALVVLESSFRPSEPQYRSLGFRFPSEKEENPFDIPKSRFAQASVVHGKAAIDKGLLKIAEEFFGKAEVEDLQVRKALPVN